MSVRGVPGAASGGGTAPEAPVVGETESGIFILKDDCWDEILSFCKVSDVKKLSSVSKGAMYPAARFVAFKSFKMFREYVQFLQDTVPKKETEHSRNVHESLERIQTLLSATLLYSRDPEEGVPLNAVKDVRNHLLERLSEINKIRARVAGVFTARKFGVDEETRETLLYHPMPKVVENLTPLSHAISYIDEFKEMVRGDFDFARNNPAWTRRFSAAFNVLLENNETGHALKLARLAPWGFSQTGQLPYFYKVATKSVLLGNWDVAQQAESTIANPFDRDFLWGHAAEAAAKQGKADIAEKALENIKWADHIKARFKKSVEEITSRQAARHPE